MSVIQLPDDPDGFRRQGRLFVPWDRFIAAFRREWPAGSHITIVARNGQGKSWLERWLLEECRPTSRVFAFDLKATDEVLRLGFHTVNDLPSWTAKQLQRLRGGREWLRIVPPAGRYRARRLVHAYMNLAWKRGSTTVLFDELRGIAGRNPNLALGEQAHVLWQRGRSRGVSVLSGFQSPVHVPRASLEEVDHLFVGRIADSRRLPALQDVVGDRGDELLDLVRQIKHKSFLFAYVPPDGPLQLVQAPAEMPGGGAEQVGGSWLRSTRHRVLYGG